MAGYVSGAGSANAGPRVVAISNQKGGVGKTTTAINLGTALAAVGERVLVLDLDPQGNASTGLGIDIEKRFQTSFDILTSGVAILDTALKTAVPNLFVVPANNDLVGIEPMLAADQNKAFKLRDAITAMVGQQRARDPETHFTYVLIDARLKVAKSEKSGRKSA